MNDGTRKRRAEGADCLLEKFETNQQMIWGWSFPNWKWFSVANSNNSQNDWSKESLFFS